VSSPRKFHGTPVSPGIAFGDVYALDRRRLSVPRFRVAPEQRPSEVSRFEAAIDVSEFQIRELESSATGSGLPQVGTLLQAHRTILRDDAFFAEVIRRIREDGINAEWAVRTTLREVRKLFEQVDNEYFRERRNDVELVGDRVLRNLLGSSPDVWSDLPEGAVVVASDLSPADTVVLASKKVQGFVTETGGRTSHTAIVARVLHVPCVLGVSGLMDDVATGDRIIIDGRSGAVVLRPDAGVENRYQGLARRRREEQAALLADRDLPAETKDGFRITLLGNIEALREVEWVRESGGEGIGLYRTEFLYIDEPEFHEVENQTRAYERVVDAMDGLPVTIRTFDWGADKERPGAFAQAGIRPGENPALGLRAIRWSLRERGSFRVQLEAVLRASARGPVRMMFPFVSEPAEVDAALKELEEVRAHLRARGVAFDPDLPVGAMVETPASVFCLDRLAERLDFFAVGTNDLIQLLMAADRANDDVGYLYRPCHPIVLRVLHQIRQQTSVPVSICGEVASDPFVTPLLVGLGFDRLSMAAASIPVVKRMVRQLRRSDCVELVRACMGFSTAAEVEQRVAECLSSWVPELVGRRGDDSQSDVPAVVVASVSEAPSPSASVGSSGGTSASGEGAGGADGE
jgi:phosphotransferase system enzyme I (PtsI)